MLAQGSTIRCKLNRRETRFHSDVLSWSYQPWPYKPCSSTICPCRIGPIKPRCTGWRASCARRLGGREEMEGIGGEIAFMAASAGKAFLVLMEPHRLMFLALGCIMGLVLGIIPGIGGLTGTAMLLPFTFTMDPYSAFALLLGLGATTATGDPIPAILFGVPGGAASAATVLDGFPMAKRGEAGRALSAAYMSSLMGGVFGALLMAVSIPILRPVMLFLGSPELLAFSVLGISMVAVLSGNAPLRGLVAGCLGIMIAMIGTDPQTGTLRWTS